MTNNAFFVILNVLQNAEDMLQDKRGSMTKVNNISHYAFRLLPGQDLKDEINRFASVHAIEAGWMLSAVGSLTDFSIRFANQPNGHSGTGHFEILSLSGTLSTQGSHLHITLGKENGEVFGGHLLTGCKIFTTAEIIIQASDDFRFERVMDEKTGFKELKIGELNEPGASNP